MNTRWYPHYVRFRQRLAMEPVRYSFATTSHDPLAQSRGVFTFHFDTQGSLWQCFGSEEMGGGRIVRFAEGLSTSESANAAYAEICREGIEVDKAIRFTLQPILVRGSRGRLGSVPLSPGKYELTLLLHDPTARSAGQRVLDVRISVPSSERPLVEERVDVFKRCRQAGRFLPLTYSIELQEPTSVEVAITPVQGKALLQGAILDPATGLGEGAGR
jgi:hypothetical protein